MSTSQGRRTNLVRTYAWTLSECKSRTPHEVSDHGILNKTEDCLNRKRTGNLSVSKLGNREGKERWLQTETE